MKRAEALKTMRSKDPGELQKQETSLREELFNLQFQHSIGQLEKSSRIPAVKRELARLKTVLREKAARG